jgi:tetratricopeptide (TPR) repeat protein
MLRYLQAEHFESLRDDVTRVLVAAEQVGDDFTLAQAWNLMGRLEASGLGNVTAGEEAWRRAVDFAEQGGYAAERAESMGWLMVMAVFGPLPTDKGIERCNEFFARAGHDETVRAFAQVERAVLEAMRGDFELARELLSEGHRRFEALGLKIWAANNAQEGFYVEMLARNPAGAAEMLRASHEAFDEMGERGFNSTISGMLAHALEAQGMDDEAEHFCRESARLAAADDSFSQVLWRTALAKVLVGRGDFDRAEALARESIGLLPYDMLTMRSYAHFDLAVALAARGVTEEAKAAADAAARLFEQKGNLVSLEHARQLVADLNLTPEAL